MLNQFKHRARLVARTAFARLMAPPALPKAQGSSQDSRITNPYSGQGVRGRDRSMSSTVSAPPLLMQFELDEAFEGSRLVRRICCKRAEVGLSKGVTWMGPDASADDITMLEKELRRLRAVSQTCKAAGWANLYGECLLVAIVQDGLPLHEPRVEGRPAPIVGLHTVDRYDISQITYYGAEVPEKAGQPENYYLRLEGVGGYQAVHESRVHRLSGDILPTRKRRWGNGMNNSILVGMWWSLMRVWTAGGELAAQLSDANVGVWQIEGFNSWISGGDVDAIQNWLDTQILYRSVLGDAAIDSKDSFSFKSRVIKDSVDVFEALLFGLAAEVDMPFTELFGRSPAGMNATGEADTDKWHESIDAYERPRLAGALEWVAGLILNQPGFALSPGDVTISWPPLRQLSQEQIINLEDKRTQTEERLVKMGALPVSAVTTRLRAEGIYEIPEDDGSTVGEGLSALEKARQGRLMEASGALHLYEETANVFRVLLGMRPWVPADREEFLATRERLGSSPAGAPGEGASNDSAPAKPGYKERTSSPTCGHIGSTCDAETGDGSRMSLVFKLPEVLAAKRPAMERDDSAPHVTFCYMPAVTNPAAVLAIVAPLIMAHARTHRASLDEVCTLLNQQGELVVYQRVRFSRGWKLHTLREDIVQALVDAGIPVSFPGEWLAHLTLAYLPDHTATFSGEAVAGSWHIDHLELWGGDEVVTLPLRQPVPELTPGGA